jgi:hypothetical protein
MSAETEAKLARFKEKMAKKDAPVISFDQELANAWETRQLRLNGPSALDEVIQPVPKKSDELMEVIRKAKEHARTAQAAHEQALQPTSFSNILTTKAKPLSDAAAPNSFEELVHQARESNRAAHAARQKPKLSMPKKAEPEVTVSKTAESEVSEIAPSSDVESGAIGTTSNTEAEVVLGDW